MEYIFPVFALGVVTLISAYINTFVDGAFFTLYLSATVLCAYFSGRIQAIILSLIFTLKIIFFDLSPDMILSHSEEIYRLFFFLTSTLISIVVILKLKDTARENWEFRVANQELLSVVSHDLRNSHNSIRMNAEFMNRTMKQKSHDEKLIRKTEIIMRNCGSMNVLINDLLVLGTQEKKNILQVATVNSSELLDHVEELMLPLAEKKQISFVVSEPGACEFQADREKLLRVFSNLIGNAIKFTPEQGKIVVSSKMNTHQIEFSVSDTGPGIHPAHIPSLFERYWQGGFHSHKGIGLGLAIAKTIVDAHGGRIEVESTLGTGTTFRFSIPLKQSGPVN